MMKSLNLEEAPITNRKSAQKCCVTNLVGDFITIRVFVDEVALQRGYTRVGQVAEEEIKRN